MIKNIKKLIKEDNKGRAWMKIPDKILTIKLLNEKKERFCPPHRIPHTFPIFGKKVNDEKCHVHTSVWRDYHHIPFCKMLGCKNYNAMLNARGRFKQIK